MNKFYLSILLLLPSLINAMAIKEKHLLRSTESNEKVFMDDNGFYVKNDSIIRKLHSYDIDKTIRNATPEQLRSYMKTGFLELRKMSNNDYKIIGHQRGLGGGPFLGMIFGITTGVAGVVGTLAATIVALPATGGASILALPAGGAATVKAVIAATALGTALPTP